MNNDAIAKITMIRCSMRCFTYGLIGLLPFVGLPFAVLALWNGGRARVRERVHWNVAKPYRIWGVICAGLGTIVWVLAAALIIVDALTGAWNNS